MIDAEAEVVMLGHALGIGSAISRRIFSRISPACGQAAVGDPGKQQAAEETRDSIDADWGKHRAHHFIG